jgi:hypothetical protein
LAPVGDDLITILNSYQSAARLKVISLHGCALSYYAGPFVLPDIQSLTLTGNSIRARASVLLQNLTTLKSLTLKQCSAIRDEDITDIGKLLDNTLEDITLHHVKITRPVATFPRLTRASFAGCFGLSDLSRFSSPNLIELNLSFCVRLSGHQIQKLIKNLPSLETLIMIKCNGVHSLDVESNHLKRLNVSFTHNLQRLGIVCPSLQQLEVRYFLNIFQ